MNAIGKAAINKYKPELKGSGLYLLMAALPIAFTGLLSGIAQGKVAAAGVQILAKKPEESTKGIIFAAMVETYAILGLLASFLIINQLG